VKVVEPVEEPTVLKATESAAALAPAPVASSSSKPSGNRGGNVKRTTVRISFDPLSGNVSGGSDPLLDPLSMMAIQASPTASSPLGGSGSGSSGSGSGGGSGGGSTAASNAAEARQIELDAERARQQDAFKIFKDEIKNDHTYVGGIVLSKGVLAEIEGSGLEEGNSSKALDRYEERMRSLVRKEERSDTVELSVKEYSAHVDKLSRRLDDAWSRDERVLSLKLAIQLAKLLSDYNVPLFYPSVFTLATDVLEKFGDKVYNRLVLKAEEHLTMQGGGRDRKVLPHNFTADDIPQATKEICRNWFYKAACIRDLVPRIYIEISLLRCYRFLVSRDEYPNILSRIASMMRGFGEPMVAIYGRAYLVHVSAELLGRAPDQPCHPFVMSVMQDTFLQFKCLKWPSFQESIQVCPGMTIAKYGSLMAPAIAWIMRAVASNATKEIFQASMQCYRDNGTASLMLKQIIDCFDGSIFSYGAMGMTSLIRAADAENSAFSVVRLYTALGKKFNLHPPPEDQRLDILNAVWRVVSKSEELVEYVECSAAWLEVIQRHYSGAEILILLKDLAKKINGRASEVPDVVVRQFEQIVINLFSPEDTQISKLEERNELMTKVLTSDNFLKILDVFKGPKRVLVSQQILVSAKKMARTRDPILISSIFEICRSVHDHVDPLTAEGERTHSSTLINAFIDKIDYGMDLEQQLSTYVDCRAAFQNLDLVKDKLVCCVAALALRANSIVKGIQNKRTAAFIKACIAYCHITIPSIASEIRKLELLLHCASTALMCQCLPQTDTLLKMAISIIPTVPAYLIDPNTSKKSHTSDRMVEFCKNLLSTLLVVPGHPEHGPFYIVQGLLNALPRYEWPVAASAQTAVYVNMLRLLCAYSQDKFPYNVPSVESNDTLYGGSDLYHEELKTALDGCLKEVFEQLTALGARSEIAAKTVQAKAALDLATVLATSMVVGPAEGSTILKLLKIAERGKGSLTRSDLKYYSNTLVSIDGFLGQMEGEACVRLRQEMQTMK